MKNKDFGHPVNNGASYEDAPVILPPSPHAPSDAEYNAAGWYRKDIQPPAPPEGKRVASVLYAVSNNKLVAEYTYEDAPVSVKVYSLYKIVLALKQIEVEVEGQTVTANVPLVEWAKANGLYEELVMAGTIKDDDDDFAAGLAAAKQLLGVTDEQIAEVLASAEV
jgi:uncharacterized protein YgbK (DUF1537 family)